MSYGRTARSGADIDPRYRGRVLFSRATLPTAWADARSVHAPFASLEPSLNICKQKEKTLYRRYDPAIVTVQVRRLHDNTTVHGPVGLYWSGRVHMGRRRQPDERLRAGKSHTPGERSTAGWWKHPATGCARRTRRTRSGPVAAGARTRTWPRYHPRTSCGSHAASG